MRRGRNASLTHPLIPNPLFPYFSLIGTSMNIIPKVEIAIRAATLADVPFMDALQKANGKALGWFPTKQFEGYVEMGGVLVAEVVGERVGYVISKDRYAGRDDVGAIYQLAVAENYRRSLVGASLVKEAFARAAYGCRLFCCWCAQDLAANRFWESLGFVPVAFRTGSRELPDVTRLALPAAA